MVEPRIGVFVCHCGKNIGGVVDVPQVVEYAKGLPNVVYAEHNLYTCSEEGVGSIKRKIKENNLNRVIVASCTPRTHEPLFRSACEEAGMNKYLFEFVNIRDQCSWVHMHLKEEATEKAKCLVSMGVAKARFLEPLEEIEIGVTPSVLVIGGGVAGMNAALNLANQGFDAHLVEREAELGGLLKGVHRLFTDNRDAQEFIRSTINRVQNHKKIKTYLSASIKEISGFIGSFDVTLVQDQAENKIKIGTIIVATGAQEFKPLGQYKYKQMPNVLTQMELEGEMKKGTVSGQNVVMINCVGARVPERTYCGRFCCVTAIKNAVLIKEDNPEAKVWILHRDLMTYGVEFENYYRKAMEAGVRFVRYDLDLPPEIIGEGKAQKVKVYHQLMRRWFELPCDLVVLTTPMVPNDDNSTISKMLKVPLSQEGFFLEAHLKLQPVEFATDGIFICGSARWPVDITEAIAQAYACASKAAIPLRRGYVKPEPITASVNELRCSGCGICEPVCAYKAINKVSKNGKTVSEVVTAQCKGCGTCGASCPAGAITMSHFTDNEIMAQIDAFATYPGA